MSNTKTNRSLLGWILFFAVGYNLLHYAAMVMVRFNDWLFIDPYFVNLPPLQFIFLAGSNTLGELLKYKLHAAIFWSILGIAGWVIQQYSLRRNVP